MASRKRKPDSPQIGLTFAGPSLPHPPAFTHQSPTRPIESDARDLDRDAADLVPLEIRVQVPAESSGTYPEATNLESFDDYDDQAAYEDGPRIRLVDPPREVAIIVEAVGDSFEVCRLRDNGTTVASVMYTRKELIELQSRIAAALEV